MHLVKAFSIRKKKHAQWYNKTIAHVTEVSKLSPIKGHDCVA